MLLCNASELWVQLDIRFVVESCSLFGTCVLCGVFAAIFFFWVKISMGCFLGWNFKRNFFELSMHGANIHSFQFLPPNLHLLHLCYAIYWTNLRISGLDILTFENVLFVHYFAPLLYSNLFQSSDLWTWYWIEWNAGLL